MKFEHDEHEHDEHEHEHYHEDDDDDEDDEYIEFNPGKMVPITDQEYNDYLDSLYGSPPTPKKNGLFARMYAAFIEWLYRIY